MTTNHTHTYDPLVKRAGTIRKGFAVTALVFALIAVPLAADQLFLGSYSHTAVEDEEAGVDFDANGLFFKYANFGGDLYWAFGLGGLTGEDELCDDNFCIDFEITSRFLEYSVGYNFSNGFTPFVTLAQSSTDVDWGITGLGLADDSDEETSVDIGGWFGGKDRRFQLALLGIDDEERSVSVGGYTVLNSGMALSGFFTRSIEGEGESTGITIGLGWSF